MPFIALYNYKLELTKDIKSIKIIVEKTRILIIYLRKLYIKLLIDIKFISEKIVIY